MISFTCSGCGQKLTVKDDLAGKTGKCPKCKQMLTVPGTLAGKTQNPVDSTRPADVEGATLPPASSPGLPRRKGDTLPPKDAPSRISQGGDTRTHPGVSGKSNSELYDFLAPAQSDDELGRLGPYRVLKMLGAGGMGVVFQAEDPQLKRKVALKAMLPSLAASESARQRFIREAQAAAAIDHDHIVHIYQVGEDRGVPFIAMQFLEGEALEDRVRRDGKLPIAQAIRIGRETAEGLAAAQKRGMIHRDIKPANLWLEGEQARVKILDFGLARAASEDSGLTQQGAIIGTPAYMAPEQGAGRAVDGRCDLFSLGCVLYRLTTGRLPFKGTDTVSTLMAVATEDPPLPHELNPSVQEGLSDLIMQLLEKDPEDRPASAAAVAKMLTALERDPKSRAGTSRKSKKKKKKSSASPWPIWAGVGGGAAVLALLIVFLLGGFGGQRQPPDNAVTKLPNQDAPPGPEKKPPQGNTEQPGKDPPAVKGDPATLNRKAAEWAVGNGGSVSIARLKGGTPSATITEKTALPQKPFWVVSAEVTGRALTDEALENLSGLTELESLSLANNPIRGAGLQFLSDSAKLKQLDLSGTQIADDSLSYLKPLKALEILKLAETPITDAAAEHLRRLTRLQWLTLSETRLSDVAVDLLKDLKQLRTLAILSTPVTEAGVRRLKAALPDCLVVTERVIAERVLEHRGQVGIGEFGFSKPRTGPPPIVSEAAKLPSGPFRIGLIRIQQGATKGPLTDLDIKLIGSALQLNVLELPFVTFPPAGLAPLSGLRQLNALVLPQVNVPDGKFQALANMKALEHLILIRVPINDADLVALKDLKDLNYLMLASTPITDAGMVHLKGLTKMRFLTLAQTAVTDVGLRELGDLTMMQQLVLSETKITGAGLGHLARSTQPLALMLDRTDLNDAGLAEVKKIKNVGSLTLSKTKITDAGMKHLVELPGLMSLYVSENPIGDPGLESIAKIPRLSYLDLSQTGVTDAGLEHLAGLSMLNYINLAKTKISDAGLLHLRKLTNLRTLHLADTKVTDKGVQELTKALPKCNVIRK